MSNEHTTQIDTDAVLDSLNLSAEQETRLIALLVETRRAARAEIYAEVESVLRYERNLQKMADQQTAASERLSERMKGRKKLPENQREEFGTPVLDEHDRTQTTPIVPRNALWRVACAMHNSDEPLCDWAELPHDDTSYGLGKATRLRHARAAMVEIGQILLLDAANG